jgi:uncharacterized protein (TIGR01777 family)
LFTILISGGSGLVGNALGIQLLSLGYKVSILGRSIPQKKHANMDYYCWNLPNKTIDLAAILSADYIIHLAGEGIAEKPWTIKNKAAILSSRVDSAQLLYEYVAKYKPNLKAFITASGIGYYGGIPAVSNEHEITEEDKAGAGFLGTTCIAWENAAQQFTTLGIRVVQLRVGVVLSPKGGALPKILQPIKYFVGCSIGSGQQYFPWIHIDDVCNMYVKAIEDNKMIGAYNAVAPSYITNKLFMKQLAIEIKRPFWPFNVPALILKIMLGSRSVLLLNGNKISAKKIMATGYKFKFPMVNEAITNLISNNN